MGVDQTCLTEMVNSLSKMLVDPSCWTGDLHSTRSSVVVAWMSCSSGTKLTTRVPGGRQAKCCHNYARWRPQSNTDYIPRNDSFSSLISMPKKCLSQICAEWWGWTWLGARSTLNRTRIEKAVWGFLFISGGSEAAFLENMRLLMDRNTNCVG